MGYELHIFRGSEWSAGDGGISAEEWASLVANQEDLRIVGFAEATTPDGSAVRYDNPGLTEWTGHPDGHLRRFDFKNGRVDIKSPDDATVERTVQLARDLRARVQGDDGEFYGDGPNPGPARRRRFRRP